MNGKGIKVKLTLNYYLSIGRKYINNKLNTKRPLRRKRGLVYKYGLGQYLMIE
jgi:hypothetical protein